jgi:hypothetical protein
MPDISGNVDALAHLRGSENVMIRMATEPEVAGQPSPLEKLDGLQKIQQSGKLLLLIIRPESRRTTSKKRIICLNLSGIIAGNDMAL